MVRWAIGNLDLALLLHCPDIMILDINMLQLWRCNILGTDADACLIVLQDCDGSVVSHSHFVQHLE